MTGAELSIDAARSSDLTAIRRLLDSEKLPSEDVTADSLRHFRLLRDGDDVIGTVGIEVHGRVALLRSLVVVGDRRGQGHAARLTSAALALAAGNGCTIVYLLTTSAAPFFEKLGFRRLARDQAPEAIKATTQFSVLCPSTATLMVTP